MGQIQRASVWQRAFLAVMAITEMADILLKAFTAILNLEICSSAFFCAAAAAVCGRAPHFVAVQLRAGSRSSVASPLCTPARQSTSRYWHSDITCLLTKLTKRWHHRYCCAAAKESTPTMMFTMSMILTMMTFRRHRQCAKTLFDLSRVPSDGDNPTPFGGCTRH